MKKKESIYYKIIEGETKGINFKEKFGTHSSWKWYNDPRQFFISLARYKFAAKILSGKKKVLEIGSNANISLSKKICLTVLFLNGL